MSKILVKISNIIRYSFKCSLEFDQNLRNFDQKKIFHSKTGGYFLYFDQNVWDFWDFDQHFRDFDQHFTPFERNLWNFSRIMSTSLYFGQILKVFREISQGFRLNFLKILDKFVKEFGQFLKYVGQNLGNFDRTLVQFLKRFWSKSRWSRSKSIPIIQKF